MKILFFLIIIIVGNHSSMACMCYSCGKYSNNESNLEWWNENDYIFKAKIDSAISKNEWRQELSFTVTKIFKGDIGAHITFDSPMFGSSCQWDLEDKIGKEFIMYGYLDEEGVLVSHFCQGSKQMLTNNEIDSLYDWKRFRTILKQEMKFIEDIAMFQSGRVKTYYSNGNITAKGSFEIYKPIGYWKYYTYDGNISSEGRYENYKKEGIWIENNYKTESTYEGHYESYLQGFKKGKYFNGEKIGEWKSFDLDGKLIEE